MNNKIILICGKSGVGKDYVVSKLPNIKQLKSYTTRPKRYKNENCHIFVSKQEFEKLNLVASTYFDNNYYGATQEQIDKCDVYIVDQNGAKELKENYTGSKKIISILLTAPLEKLVERMTKRGDSIQEINNRIHNDAIEFKNIEKHMDYIIENDDINNTTNSILEIIERN